jgi:hypothetical protein
MKPRARTITVDCDAGLSCQVGDAIACYADAAYPRGGSECAQIARETLLDTAARCRAHGGGVLELPKRQIPLVKAALRWYCENDGASDAPTAERLRGLFD